MTSQTHCPDPACWTDLLNGQLPANKEAALAAHLDGCPACQRAVEQLAADTGPWTEAARHLDEALPAPDPVLRRVIDQLKEAGVGEETGVEAQGAATTELNFLAPAAGAGHLGRVGPYEVLGVIGRGGMGVVLKARDPALDRVVAVKVLAPQWAASAAARLRFSREARAMAAVHHDNIVAVHAVAEIRDLPYLVMEYVRGTSLQELLSRNGPLELEDVLRIGAQAAAGLEAAHQQGLVHRDIKPANILVERGSDRVKLTDFGLARAADDASLTQSGVISGTPLYMAPEQARGDAVDHRADLFSLGSVLYALCTGRPPFRASSTLAVLRCVCDETPPPVRERCPDAPLWLEEIIAVLHAKDPAERFQSAAEVADLLERHLAHLQDPRRAPAPAKPIRRRSRPLRRAGRGRRVLLVGLLLLAVAALAVPLLWRAFHRDSSPIEDAASEWPPVKIANARTSRAPFTVQVDYRFPRGQPKPGERYVWVVRPAGMPFAAGMSSPERVFHAVDLQGQGTATIPLYTVAYFGTADLYLAIEKAVPGQLAPQREQVSNQLRLQL